MLLLYGAAIFLSATLLFLVQPMVGKMVLPVLGGTPAVWNTCMVFFQVLLLAGYGYAHVLTGKTGARAQTLVHAAGSALPILALPIGLPVAQAGGLAVPTGDYPITWLLGVLMAMAGLPFLALSANGPLLQRWFSATDHPRASNPYFLYAASNAGSLAALLGYPTVVEPNLTLSEQSRAWSWGYGVLVVLLIACAVARLRRGAGAAPGPAEGSRERRASEGTDAPITWRRRVTWVLLGLAPSSLMIGSTTYISTDLAPVPLLWVVPLSIYLVSMIVAFSRFAERATRAAAGALPVLVVAVAVLMLMDVHGSIAAIVGVHLAVLLVAATACHGRLSMTRPGASHLTEFYFLMSVGGALGGMFNAVAAPLVFDRLLEYPIAIGACLALTFPGARGIAGAWDAWRARLSGLLSAGLVWAGLGIALVASGFMVWMNSSDLAWGRVALLAIGGALGLVLIWSWRAGEGSRAGRIAGAAAAPLAIGALFLLLLQVAGVMGFSGAWVAGGAALVSAAALVLLAGRAWCFVGGAACLLVIAAYAPAQPGTTLLAGRTFFGVHRVVLTPSGSFVEFVHGSTQHGAQARDEEARYMPTTYFHPTGPAGDVFGLLNTQGRVKTVGVIGLGAGSLAAYSLAGQEFTFYEIDPAIVRVARDTRYFTYLSDARGRVRCEVGDGRLLLRRSEDARFDLLVVDAFNSDSIPMHLITTEAMRLYMDRLSEHGVLLVQATNRHLFLPLVLAGNADRLGLSARAKEDVVTAEQAVEGKFASRWVAIARRPEDLEFLDGVHGWIRLYAIPGVTKVWTDDFSNILSVLGRANTGR